MDQNLVFFILLVSDNMGVVKGRSKIIIAHVICHAQNVYNYLEKMLCVIWAEYQRVPVSVLFFCSIEVCNAHPPKKLSTWYRISPRVSRFCINPNESTAIWVPGLTIELKAHAMCGICGIHVNSCGKNHGTGIKSNMLQECRGVSDVAQNYTTQTGFRAVSSKKYFVPSIQL